MRALPLLWSIGLTACTLCAQAVGVPPEWETRKLLESVVNNARKLEPIVGEINPAGWKEKGAPEAYQAQWKTVRNAIAGLRASASQLAKEPTSLSFALDTLFRLDGLNIYLSSFAAGVRRYQNPALADILVGVADENSANRESLKQYALDLASSKEGELKVMESEAQRCLGIIVKQPPGRPRPPAAPKDRK
ncbi:MAG: hypothetical protein ACKV2U_05865 [Bryobacteraceae bacterium]